MRKTKKRSVEKKRTKEESIKEEEEEEARKDLGTAEKETSERRIETI